MPCKWKSRVAALRSIDWNVRLSTLHTSEGLWPHQCSLHIDMMAVDVLVYGWCVEAIPSIPPITGTEGGKTTITPKSDTPAIVGASIRCCAKPVLIRYLQSCLEGYERRAHSGHAQQASPALITRRQLMPLGMSWQLMSLGTLRQPHLGGRCQLI